MNRTYSFCATLWIAALVMLWCAFQAQPAEPAIPTVKAFSYNPPNEKLNTIIKNIAPRATAVPVISAHIVRSAADYRLPVPVVVAVIWTESTFNAAATNGKDHGLMGIRESVWRDELGAADLRDPGDNIAAGCYILDKYRAQYGSLQQALKYYNGGSDKYARRVLARAKKIKEEFYE